MSDIWVSESSASFEKRILALTGKHLCELEDGKIADLVSANIFCTRNTSSGREYVYGTCPEEDEETGVKIYTRFFWVLVDK